MRIRTLDQDLSGNQFEMYWGGNGDVYVTVYENGPSEDAQKKQTGTPHTVRVGMCGSRMRMPRRMRTLLSELATEFEKWRECRFESDAFEKSTDAEFVGNQRF